MPVSMLLHHFSSDSSFHGSIEQSKCVDMKNFFLLYTDEITKGSYNLLKAVYETEADWTECDRLSWRLVSWGDCFYVTCKEQHFLRHIFMASMEIYQLKTTFMVNKFNWINFCTQNMSCFRTKLSKIWYWDSHHYYFVCLTWAQNRRETNDSALAKNVDCQLSPILPIDWMWAL